MVDIAKSINLLAYFCAKWTWQYIILL